MRNRGLEVELLAQAHSAREQRSWDLNQREGAFPGAEAEGAGAQPGGLLNLRQFLTRFLRWAGYFFLFWGLLCAGESVQQQT